MQWYQQILQDFGFNREDDEKSARCLNEILNRQGSISMDDLPSGENFIIFGAGPSLKKHIKSIKKLDMENYILSAADGATTALLEEDLIPDIIVTDLDGNIEDILEAHQQHSHLVVHAHGNNLENILRYADNLKNIMGTTQSIPLEYLYNFGGFSDGDRAVFLAVELGAKKIILAGMDFGKRISRYSRPEMEEEVGNADPIKVLKLKYAEKLIQWIKNHEKVEIYNLVFMDDYEKFLDDFKDI